MPPAVSTIQPFAQRPADSNVAEHSGKPAFSRNADVVSSPATTNSASTSKRPGVDGMFRRHGYQQLSAQSPANAAETQARNGAVGNLVARMQLSDNRVYHAFQHNGQSALFMQRPGGDYHLSFHNGHQPASRLQRFLHPAQPFQFSINGATNEVVQTRGPTQLNQAQIVAALQAINLSM